MCRLLIACMCTRMHLEKEEEKLSIVFNIRLILVSIHFYLSTFTNLFSNLSKYMHYY